MTHSGAYVGSVRGYKHFFGSVFVLFLLACLSEVCNVPYLVDRKLTQLLKKETSVNPISYTRITSLHYVTKSNNYSFGHYIDV